MIQLRARKSLGQHFLSDQGILKRIVQAARVEAGDEVIEIGPGTGLLTVELLKTPLQRLTAYELDERAVPELRDHFAAEGKRFRLIEEDILKADLASISQEADRPLKVVGNIPYYITSPILFMLIGARTFVRDAVLLVQLEVAERLVAKPRTKEYGIPTVLANFFGEVEFLFKVKAGSFKPPPKVDSAVIRIDFTKGYFARLGIQPEADFVEGEFQSFVRGLFRMRRKTIRNNLKGLISPEAVEHAETNAGQFLTRRAEELDIALILELYRIVSQK